jgi:HD-GYP domain-containing protein (c-di-GMP phosphodiesterase class II)
MTPSEQTEPKSSGGTGLLRALNAAAASLQRSIHGERDVYQAFREQITALGLRGGISLLDETGELLTFQVIAYSSAIMRVISAFEARLGLHAEGYSVKVDQVDVYRRVICDSQAVFVPDTSSISASVMPPVARWIIAPLLSALGSPPGVFAPLIVDDHPCGMLNVVGADLTEADLPTIQAFANHIAVALTNAHLVGDLQKAHRSLETAYNATLEGWVKALDLRDHETEGHSLRVSGETVRLARRLGLPEQELAHIQRGALLHDIGKMAIPDSILLKPGLLDEEEWKQVRMHPILAYEWISGIDFLLPAADIPYCHHERWDGSGYPRKLAGEQIPLAARIFAVVDAWDAMTSDRPYRAALSLEQVRAYLREQAGKQFDPQVTAVFLQQLDDKK